MTPVDCRVIVCFVTVFWATFISTLEALLDKYNEWGKVSSLLERVDLGSLPACARETRGELACMKSMVVATEGLHFISAATMYLWLMPQGQRALVGQLLVSSKGKASRTIVPISVYNYPIPGPYFMILQDSNSSFPSCRSCCILPFPPTQLRSVEFGSEGLCNHEPPRIILDARELQSASLDVNLQGGIKIEYETPNDTTATSDIAQGVLYGCNSCGITWKVIPQPFGIGIRGQKCGNPAFLLLCDPFKDDLFLGIGQTFFKVIKFEEGSVFVASSALSLEGCALPNVNFLSLGKALRLFFSNRNTLYGFGCNTTISLTTDGYGQLEEQSCSTDEACMAEAGSNLSRDQNCGEEPCCKLHSPGNKEDLRSLASQMTVSMPSSNCLTSRIMLSDDDADFDSVEPVMRLVYKEDRNDGGMSRGLKVGIGTIASSLGLLGLIALLAVTVFYLRKHRRKRQMALQLAMRPAGAKSPRQEALSSGPPSSNAAHTAESSSDETMDQLAHHVVAVQSHNKSNQSSSELTAQHPDVVQRPAAVRVLFGAADYSSGSPKVAGPLLPGDEGIVAVVNSGGGNSSGGTPRPRRIPSLETDRVATNIDMKGLEFELSDIDLKLENVIGGGGYGTVYKWERLGTTYAVKVVRCDPKDIHLLWQEVDLLRALRHPNVVQFIYAWEKPPNEIYIVMEYVPKGSLFSLLHERKTQLSTWRKLHMAWDIAKGMAFLHELNVVHRDLKTLNLLVSFDGTIKVCDFGQARLLYGHGTHVSTRNRAGTLPYTAPEAFDDFQKSPKQSDVYAFGIILWELFSGEIPWNRFAEVEVMKVVVMDMRRPEIGEGWPPDVVDLINRCWDQDPMARPPFASIVSELKRIMDSIPVGERKATPRKKSRAANGASEAPVGEVQDL